VRLQKHGGPVVRTESVRAGRVIDKMHSRISLSWLSA
jgi:hypothetical protein